ncbi:MAG TPA: ATP synthase F1 subunit epsilon [Bacteroidetes bacterium]|nr:ATP synthase F1 subunit epsilon [Bacteroidota bacterium]
MELVVLTPEQEFFNGEVKSVTVPGASGEFEVLENHAPLVSEITSGTVKLVLKNGEKMLFEVNKGFLEVINNDLALLVNEIKPID